MSRLIKAPFSLTPPLPDVTPECFYEGYGSEWYATFWTEFGSSITPEIFVFTQGSYAGFNASFGGTPLASSIGGAELFTGTWLRGSAECLNSPVGELSHKLGFSLNGVVYTLGDYQETQHISFDYYLLFAVCVGENPENVLDVSDW